MKKLGFLFIAAIFIMGNCSRKNIKVIESSFDNGQPKVVTFYDKFNGEKKKTKQITYYQNGQKKMEGTFEKGKRHGQWTSYYKNGTVWSEVIYKEGKANGIKKTFYKNGDLYYKGQLKNGKRIGKWVFYDTKGGKTVIDYDKRNEFDN